MFARHLSGGELTEYADGEMVGARRRRAQQHLSRCERCARALDALWEVVGEVRASRDADAPYDLRLRVASRLSPHALRPIPCRLAREFIQQDLDGELPPLSVGLLRLHLDGCQACAGEQRTLAATTRLVRSLPVMPAPLGIWEKALAGRRARPAPSWGVRLRPVLAAAAMAAGAVVLGLHALPPPAGQVVARGEGRPAAPRIGAVAPSPAAPPSAVTPPVAPAPTVVARAGERVSRAAAVSAVRTRRPPQIVRQVAMNNMEQSPAPRVVAITLTPQSRAPKVEAGAVPPRKSQGLRALAMMAKAVSSQSEGRVSLGHQLEPWEVFGDETISEVPLTAEAPADAPGADSSGAPSGQPKTGAREVRPGLAETAPHAA